MKRILILRSVKLGTEIMGEVTYVGFSRDANESETCVRFRIKIIYVGIRSPEPWPVVHDAGGAEPS